MIVSLLLEFVDAEIIYFYINHVKNILYPISAYTYKEIIQKQLFLT